MSRSTRHSSSIPQRGVRVAEQLMQELAGMIRTEVKDPRVGFVTLTGVELTPDYAYANIYFTVLPDDPETVAKALQGLQRASGFLRSHIGRRVRIHTTPELRFKHDASVERGAHMAVLINQANARRAADADPEPAADNSAVPDTHIPDEPQRT